MSLIGVVGLNLLFLLAGTGILWGVRGWTSWGDYVALAGVAYVSGLCAVSVVATLVPIWGGSLSVGVIFAIVTGVGLAGLGAGIWKRRPLPARPGQ